MESGKGEEEEGEEVSQVFRDFPGENSNKPFLVEYFLLTKLHKLCLLNNWKQCKNKS